MSRLGTWIMTLDQSPVPPLPPEITFPWWIDAIIYAPVLIALLVVIYLTRQALTGSGLVKKQSAFLDHQRSMNEQALDQSKTFEEMIAKQYQEANSRTDQALAQSSEAIRLHAAALEQLAAMNLTLARIGRMLEDGQTKSSS